MKRLSVFLLLAALLISLAAATSAAPRKILVEIQTSTTCAPCYAADVFYFQNWLPNYGGASSVATIAYHVWWPSPGNDPMYLANTAHVQTRVSYYSGGGSTYAPRAYIDGFIDGTSAYNTWPGHIESRFLDPSPITITITGTRGGNTLNLNAAIYAEQAVNSGNWRVHWVVVESGISAPQFNGSTYVPFIHDHAMRFMYPDANGSPITISQGQTVNIARTITLNSAWVANNCRVIVFVQNNTDKKVQQVEFIEVPDIPTSVGDPVGGVPTTFALSQNYPNPFNPSTAIDYALSERAFVTIKVHNLLGQEVKTLVAEEKGAGIYTLQWNGKDNAGNDVPSGMYLYTMRAGNFVQTKKMMLMK
jgi:hypothetical protein